MKEKEKKTYSVLFQKINQFESPEDDIRFLKVKIWLMHLGVNLNNSYFSKEVVEAAIPTLANTPILSYIEKNSEDEIDFSDHRQIIVKKDGKYAVKYIGTAIGTIPSENNAQFEDRLCDDGVTRTFLTIEGLIWRKFDDPVDILTRDISKAESMEIADDYEGEFKEDGFYHFSKFSFFGACGLGLNVSPAMQNATIEVQFSEQDFTKEVNEKMERFKTLFSKRQNQVENVEVVEKHIEWKCPHCFNIIGEKELYFDGSSWFHSPCRHIGEIIFSDDDKNNLEFNYKLQEGGKNLEKVLELLSKYSLTLEDLTSKNINHEEVSLEELEIKIQDTFKKEDITTEFSLTSEQLEDELRRELAEIETIVEDYYGDIYSYSRYYYSDSKPDQGIVIAWDCKNCYLIGFNFKVTGDNVEVDSSTGVRYKADLIPMDLSSDTDNDEVDDMFSFFTSKGKSEFMIAAKEKSLTKQFEADKESAVSELQTNLLELNTKYSALEVELAQLQEFKLKHEDQVKQDKIEEAFQKYSSILDKEEIETLREKSSTCENVDEFIRDFKSFACDKLLAKSSMNKNGHVFVGITQDLDTTKDDSDNNSVWSRLKNKK